VSVILVLDDDATFGQLVKTVFMLEGYQAEIVPDPDALLPMARQLEPMLVLLDVHFQQQETFGLVQALRADDSLRGLPVLMTSGMECLDACLNAGADAFLLKPFHADELLAMIASLVPREGASITNGQT
jgi:DNA-binding response OmpR family regulator